MMLCNIYMKNIIKDKVLEKKIETIRCYFKDRQDFGPGK